MDDTFKIASSWMWYATIRKPQITFIIIFYHDCFSCHQTNIIFLNSMRLSLWILDFRRELKTWYGPSPIKLCSLFWHWILLLFNLLLRPFPSRAPWCVHIKYGTSPLPINMSTVGNILHVTQKSIFHICCKQKHDNCIFLRVSKDDGIGHLKNIQGSPLDQINDILGFLV